jgi:hypothetical protein
MSRQSEWQDKMKAKGLCMVCGKRKIAKKRSKGHCAICLDKVGKRTKSRYRQMMKVYRNMERQ